MQNFLFKGVLFLSLNWKNYKRAEQLLDLMLCKTKQAASAPIRRGQSLFRSSSRS